MNLTLSQYQSLALVADLARNQETQRERAFISRHCRYTNRSFDSIHSQPYSQASNHAAANCCYCRCIMNSDTQICTYGECYGILYSHKGEWCLPNIIIGMMVIMTMMMIAMSNLRFVIYRRDMELN